MNPDVRDLVAGFVCGSVADAIALRQASSAWRLAVDSAVRRIVAADQPPLDPTSQELTTGGAGLRAPLHLLASEAPGPMRSAVCRAFGCGRGNAWRSVTRLIILSFGIDASPAGTEALWAGRRPVVLHDSAVESAYDSFAWFCKRPPPAHNVAGVRRLLSDLRSVLVRFTFTICDVPLPPPLTSPGAFELLSELRLVGAPGGIDDRPASPRAADAVIASYRALLRNVAPQLRTLALDDAPTPLWADLASMHEFPTVTAFMFSTSDDAAASRLLSELRSATSPGGFMPKLTELSWTAPTTDSMETVVSARPALGSLTLRRHVVSTSQAAGDVFDRVAAHQLAAERSTAARLRVLDLATPFPVVGFPRLERVHVRLHDLPQTGWWAPGEGPGAAVKSLTLTVDSFFPRNTHLAQIFPAATSLSVRDDPGDSMMSMAPTDRHFERLEPQLPSTLTSIDVDDIPVLDERILLSLVAEADVPAVASITASTRLLLPIIGRYGLTLQHLDLRGDYRATTHVDSDMLGDDFALPSAVSVRIPTMADAGAFVRGGRSSGRFPQLELLSLRCLGPVTASDLRAACPRLFTIVAAVEQCPVRR
jgi:hypothetical protein